MNLVATNLPLGCPRLGFIELVSKIKKLASEVCLVQRRIEYYTRATRHNFDFEIEEAGNESTN